MCHLTDGELRISSVPADILRNVKLFNKNSIEKAVFFYTSVLFTPLGTL